MLTNLAKLLPLLAISIAAPVFAASTYSSPNPAREQIASGNLGKRADNLNLTSEQKTKIEQLSASTRTQIDAVLTPAQRQQLEQIKAQRQADKQGDKGMSLTADQKAKLTAIRTASKEQFKAILTPGQQAQLGAGGRGWGKGDSMAQLNLTSDQKVKIEQLRATSRTQMEAVLTPAQQEQAKAQRDRRQAMGNTWKRLNLTTEQQAQIKTIRQSSDRQLNAILTPEQQAKYKSYRYGGRNNSI